MQSKRYWRNTLKKKSKKLDHIHNWVSDGILISSKKCGQCGVVRNFELGDQDKTEELQPYVDKVLKALGHSDALATDESYVTDFLDVFASSAEKGKMLKKLSKKLKVEVSVQDYVWQVAERLKKAKKAKDE